jgi:hypothetical protein
MKQKILIDDYFKQELGEAEERLNLGAWANMERMLNGENPYEKEKDNKKPFFYIISAIALLSLLIFGVQQYLQIPNNKNVIASNTLKISTNNVDSTAINASINIATKENQKNAEQLKTKNNTALEKVKQINQKEDATNSVALKSINPIIKSNKPTYKSIASQKSNKTIVNNMNTIEAAPVNTLTNATNAKALMPIDNNASNAATLKNNPSELKLNKDSKVKRWFAKNKTEKNVADKLNIEAINNDLVAKDEKLKLNKVEFAKTSIKATIKNIFNKKSDAKINSITTNNIKNLKVPDSINAVVVNTKTSKQNGKKITIIDTISQFKMAKPEQKIIVNAEPISVSNITIAPEKSNPRLVKKALTAQEQQKADAIAANSTAKKIKKQNAIDNKNTVSAATLVANEKTANDKIKNEINKKLAPQHKFNKQLSDKILATIERAKALGHLDIGSFRIPVNPGMFVGINATLLNTQHDFGGFQMGANLAMQLKRNFQFIPHIGLYYRNSGGYSVKDTALTISQKSGPIRFGTQDVFSYQSSQNAYTYNFKHYLSIEMPLILQYDVKDWGFYGGMNIAYGFKLNPTQYAPKNYTFTHFDTVGQNAPYVFATDKGTYYKSPDFNARFGLGFALGLNYQINNNLYVDMRYVHNTWVNSITASSNDISKQQFLKGSFQLSMGYRFNETDRYK